MRLLRGEHNNSTIYITVNFNKKFKDVKVQQIFPFLSVKSGQSTNDPSKENVIWTDDERSYSIIPHYMCSRGIADSDLQESFQSSLVNMKLTKIWLRMWIEGICVDQVHFVCICIISQRNKAMSRDTWWWSLQTRSVKDDWNHFCLYKTK